MNILRLKIDTPALNYLNTLIVDRNKVIPKYTCIAFLLISFNVGVCQASKVDSDSLSKYSYTIAGYVKKNGTMDMGTCSFIKRGGNLYLVTAKHVLYECDSTRKYIKIKPDMILLKLSGALDIIQLKIPIPSDTCMDEYNDPDLAVIKMDNSLIGKVNTIDEFIMPPLTQYGGLMIFGQGMKGDSIVLRFDQQHKIEIEGNSFTFYSSPPAKDSNFIDSVHIFIETRNTTVGNWMKGFSGAPVFLRDTKTNRWRFCGIFVQGVYPVSTKFPGGLILVKPDYILRNISLVE